jgi:hypothetical protein
MAGILAASLEKDAQISQLVAQVIACGFFGKTRFGSCVHA